MPQYKKFCEEPILMLSTISEVYSGDGILDEETKRAIIDNASNIRTASRTKIREEIEKIIMSDRADEGIFAMFDCGLLKYTIPQLDRCFYEPQRNKYHIYNVGEHIANAVKYAPPIPIVKWAALFHDIGKPKCSSCDSYGIIHFYGHHIESVKIVNDVCHRLNFDINEIKEISTLVEYHDVHFEPTVKGVKKALARLGEQTYTRLLYLQEADARAKSPDYYEDKKHGIERMHSLKSDIITSGEIYRYSDLAISKRDLIKLKFKADRQMRDVIKTLFDEVIENKKLNNREYLIKRAIQLKNKY